MFCMIGYCKLKSCIRKSKFLKKHCKKICPKKRAPEPAPRRVSESHIEEGLEELADYGDPDYGSDEPVSENESIIDSQPIMGQIK